MLYHGQPQFPVLTGDWKLDGPKLITAWNRFLQSLNDDGALAIVEKSKWTPAITFATPGDLAVTYTTQVGDLAIIDGEVRAGFRIITSAFTHTTAAGNLQITGLPIQANSDSGFVWSGALPSWGGITMAGGRTQCGLSITAGTSVITVTASGSAVASANITAAEMPTGGAVVLRGDIRFRI